MYMYMYMYMYMQPRGRYELQLSCTLKLRCGELQVVDQWLEVLSIQAAVPEVVVLHELVDHLVKSEQAALVPRQCIQSKAPPTSQ